MNYRRDVVKEVQYNEHLSHCKDPEQILEHLWSLVVLQLAQAHAERGYDEDLMESMLSSDYECALDQADCVAPRVVLVIQAFDVAINFHFVRQLGASTMDFKSHISVVTVALYVSFEVFGGFKGDDLRKIVS